MNLGQIADLCIRSKPTWQRPATIRALAEWQAKHHASWEDTEAMAISAIADPESRTPTALTWQPAPADPQPAFAGLPEPPMGDQPEVPIYCAHGVGLWDRTKTGEPACPYCRGVTRAKRNRFVPGFRLAGHRPCEHDDDVPAAISLDEPPAAAPADEPDLSHEGMPQ